jgi:hypothetical protein
MDEITVEERNVIKHSNRDSTTRPELVFVLPNKTSLHVVIVYFVPLICYPKYYPNAATSILKRVSVMIFRIIKCFQRSKPNPIFIFPIARQQKNLLKKLQ